MSKHEAKDALHQLDCLLSANNQSWLFGAGISKDAGIPLMYPLTHRVRTMAIDSANPDVARLIDFVGAQLPPNAHVEHYLSHLGDYLALAERQIDKTTAIDGESFELARISQAYTEILHYIGDTVRYGYRATDDQDPEIIGTFANPIVEVKDHLKFIKSLFISAQGVANRRKAVRLFTTNYDSLLEDALALNCVQYWDGFSGGAVAFRSFRYGDTEPSDGFQAHLIKLHGSIDWHLGDDGKVWRVRDKDIYPERASKVLIYPQSTKYIATQRDPFAGQFELLRRALNVSKDHVFITCGYSFGDEHINQEIELSFQNPDSKTTLVAFIDTPNALLLKWMGSRWGSRVYVASANGLYKGSELIVAPAEGQTFSWWTFQGLINLLQDGAEGYLG